MKTENSESSLFDFDLRASAIDDLHSQTAIYTATHVIESLLDRVGWANDGGTLIDPSCGDANILLSALARLPIVPNDLKSVSRVKGWEIHPGAVISGRGRVAGFLVERGWKVDVAREAAESMIIEADFLTDGPAEGEQYDFVVANPPYLRYAHLSKYFQDLYRGRLPGYTHGDILYSFLDACVRIIPSDGVIALVTADRWLFNEGAGELRKQLGEIVGIDHVARLDVTTSFYRPKRRIAGSLPRVHPVEVILRPKAAAARALTAEAVQIDSSLKVATRTLSDIADVVIGPWLATDGVWTIPLEDAGKFPGEKLIPAVNAKDLDPKTDRYEGPSHYAIFTHRDAEPSPRVCAHIKDLSDTLSERAKEGLWWMPPEAINMGLVSRAKLVVPVISRQLRLIDIPAGVLPYTHQVNVVIPKAGYSFADLRRLLLSSESQEWFRQQAAPIDGGFYQLRTRKLRELPVPDDFESAE